LIWFSGRLRRSKRILVLRNFLTDAAQEASGLTDDARTRNLIAVADYVVRAAGLAGDSKQYPSLGQWRRMFVDMASPALVAQALKPQQRGRRHGMAQ